MVTWNNLDKLASFEELKKWSVSILPRLCPVKTEQSA